MAEIQIFLHSLSIANLGLNWLDIVIIVVFLFYTIEGFEIGFFASVFDLFTFVVSFLLGLKFYGLVGGLLIGNLAISVGLANAVAFFMVAALSELTLSIVMRKVFILTQTLFFRTGERKVGIAYMESINRMFGVFPGFASSYILLAFFLTTVMALPFSAYLRQSVTSSRFGNNLVVNTHEIEKKLSSIFGGALYETLNFLTVKPEGDEVIDLRLRVANPIPDEKAEEEMLVLINRERENRGISPVDPDTQLRDAARSHSKDMLQRGYFSHFTPEGASPSDRLSKASIDYNFTGENLAFAPNVELAMKGLMDSPGHKANILSQNFRKVGIGVMDGGVYGQMFSQEFSD